LVADGKIVSDEHVEHVLAAFMRLFDGKKRRKAGTAVDLIATVG
jgi:hypothetical protein